MVKVSIIIPCYNQGNYIKEAIESIEVIEGCSFEIIVINDGSTDKETNEILGLLKDKGYNVIYQKNMGLSAARNTGITMAKGEYILPLDADNKILAPYLNEAVSILDSMPGVAMVYGDAQHFGDVNEVFIAGSFNLQKLMLANYIDACTLIRKDVLIGMGNFDTNIKHGMEDWELWLRLSFKGYQFYYLNQLCFCYRVRYHSMMRTTNRNFELINNLETYINQKFPDKMSHYWVAETFIKRFKKSPLKLFIKLLIRAYWPSKYNELLKSNKVRNGI
jgi:glycosyltransferase involved in cell wall biosynthesis